MFVIFVLCLELNKVLRHLSYKTKQKLHLDSKGD